MDNGAILKLEKMPASCSECEYEKNCVARDNANRNDFKTWEKRPLHCPLQEGVVITKQQQTELLEALEELYKNHAPYSPSKMEYCKLYKALGGNDSE